AEDRRAVHAREHADLAADRANVFEAAPVRTHARQNRLARRLLFDLREDLADLLDLGLLLDDGEVRRIRIGDRRGHFLDQIFHDLRDRIGAVVLARPALHFADLVGHAGANGVDEAGVRLLDVADLLLL